MGMAEPWRTQAVYHAVAERMTADTPDTVILTWPASPYLCLGYHQVFPSVLERSECARLGLPVLRRRVGGGATYLDSAQLFYQFVFHHSRLPANFRTCYTRLLAGPVAALRRLGLSGALRDVNEVEVDGRRIAGIGGGRIGEAVVIVGNFLFDFDYETMARVWRVPWPSFRRLAANALLECVTTFRREGVAVSHEVLCGILTEELAGALGRPLTHGGLSRDEERASTEVGVRLASEPFLNLHGENGAAAMRALKISSRGHIRAVEAERKPWNIRASFFVHDDIIREAEIESSPPGTWGDVETRLGGVPFAAWEAQFPAPDTRGPTR